MAQSVILDWVKIVLFHKGYLTFLYFKSFYLPQNLRHHGEKSETLHPHIQVKSYQVRPKKCQLLSKSCACVFPQYFQWFKGLDSSYMSFTSYESPAITKQPVLMSLTWTISPWNTFKFTKFGIYHLKRNQINILVHMFVISDSITSN